MGRVGVVLVILALVAVFPALAGAQSYPTGRLLDPALINPPEHVPPGPVGEYPEDWAKCVAETNPDWPTAPAGLDPRGVDPSLPNPLLGQRFFVDRMEPAYMQWARWKRGGENSHADMIWKLAREPRFRWFGKFTRPRMQKKVRGYLDRVQCDQPGSVPLMAVMRHQGKGCSGTYQAGGNAEDRRTMEWYDDFAEAVGDARVVIGFEPDSLGTVDCLAPNRRQDRLNVLRYGVNRLSQLPNATIYLEAGASDWEAASRTAEQLRYIGISMVGGKHFIINTSYNGRGPLHYKKWLNKAQHKWRRINVWCNPGLRGLGPAPTTATSHPLVDAYMYINRPGYSAGSCNGGPLPVGTWWPERGLMYAEYATDWEAPPKGTVYGHFKRYSLKALGAFGR